jgi:hypothetical protein
MALVINSKLKNANDDQGDTYIVKNCFSLHRNAVAVTVLLKSGPNNGSVQLQQPQRSKALPPHAKQVKVKEIYPIYHILYNTQKYCKYPYIAGMHSATAL